MQRVRVGLTGLAFVFLLVMLATAFLRSATRGDAGGNAAPVALNDTAPTEPLAQLGVVPGNAQPAAAPEAAKLPQPTDAPPAR